MPLCLFLFFLIAVTAHAADPPARSCRILFLYGPDDAPEKLHLFDGTGSQQVELPRMNFSPVYEVSAEATTLELLPSTLTAGTPPAIPSGAPTVSLAESITDFYLIVSSDPSNQVAPVKMQVVRADMTRFKRGQMLWHNLTDNKVGGIIGSRKLLVEPNSRLILDAPANGRKDYHVNIHFLPPGKQRPEPLCETRWTHDPRSRSVLFIFKPTGAIIPRILGFSDFRSEMDSKSEAAP